MKKTLKIQSMILFLILTMLFNTLSFAVTDPIYVTVKKDVPIRPDMYAKSGVVRHLDAGTFLTIAGQNRNSHGNLWYKTINGNWVYYENVEKVNVALPSAGNYIANREGVPLRYGANAHYKIRARLPLNTVVYISSVYYADTGSLWGDLKYNGDHYKVYMGNLSKYTATSSSELCVGDIVELTGRYYASSFNSNTPGKYTSGTYVIDRISANPSSIHPYGIKPVNFTGTTISGWASKEVLNATNKTITISGTSVAEEQKQNEPTYTPREKPKANPIVDVGNNIVAGAKGIAKGSAELAGDAWDSVTGLVNTTIDTGAYLINTVKERNIIEDNIELFNIITNQIDEDGIFTSDHLEKITNTYDPLIDTINQNIQELPSGIRDELASGLEEALQSGDPVEVYSSLFQLTVKSAGMVYEGMNIFDKKLASKVMDKVDDIEDIDDAYDVWKYSSSSIDDTIQHSDDLNAILRYSDILPDVIPDIGFKSYDDLKDYLPKLDSDHQWHHIVEQSQIGRRADFPSEAINNVGNVVAIPSGANSVHSKISGYYSSKLSFTDDLTVRDWLATKDFDFQFSFGMAKLSEFGTVTPSPTGWIFTPNY